MNKTRCYLFDPLCGGCHDALPAPAPLEAANVRVELLPTGIFSGQRARAINDYFANCARNNEQRIRRLSGQRFSAYDRQQRCDSGPASLVLTAVALTSPAVQFLTTSKVRQP